MGGGAMPGGVLPARAMPKTSPTRALQEPGAVQREWFPELRREAEQLVAVHRRLIGFLLTQRKLRRRDPYVDC